MLFEGRSVGNVSRAYKRMKHTVESRHSNVRAVKLLLHNYVVVTIARLKSCDARLAQLRRMIARPHATARQMRDVPVVFHSQWFSSFFHGESTFLVDNPKPMQCPLPTLTG